MGWVIGWVSPVGLNVEQTIGNLPGFGAIVEQQRVVRYKMRPRMQHL